MDILQKSETSSSLQKKTSSILDVFTKTITNLQDVITNAKDQVKVKEEEIKSAQAEKEALEKIAADNQTIIDKISSLLK